MFPNYEEGRISSKYGKIINKKTSLKVNLRITKKEDKIKKVKDKIDNS